MATILVTTHDLDDAVELKGAFTPQDTVEFAETAGDISRTLTDGASEETALILTGVDRDQETRNLLAAATHEGRRMPVLAVFDAGIDAPGEIAAELGLDEFFVKPVDLEEVVVVVRRLIRRKSLQNEIGIVGKTAAVQEVIERVTQIAPVGSTVLITGESGTGKELVARGLHKLSPRRGKAFIPVNIAALPETLLESELFGHEKGAFTGAASRRKGMFELADQGTIFLDEIAEMPSGPQTKLLRVLEQREFMRVGGTEPIRVDVRVLAATNKDLRRAVELGEFRRDLYYRLNVLHIDMPPLRERREDIPLLVHAFINELSRQHEKEFKGIAPEAMEMLVRYDWPGNVRELRNLVESMVVLAPGSVIRPADIPPEVRRGAGQGGLPTEAAAPPVPRSDDGTARMPEMEFIFRTLVELKLDMEDLRQEFEAYKRRHPELVRPSEEPSYASIPRELMSAASEPEDASVVVDDEVEERVEGPAPEERDNVIQFEPGMTMQELERRAIIATLRAVDGNRRRASEELGIGERTLYRKLKEYEIEA